jgi:glycine oxidase
MDRLDVAIAGGGIMGLATALELAAAGRKVTVFDRTEAMSEASRAAAGMLAGEDPENPPALTELARYSLSIYPEFLARIEELSGSRIPIRTTATIQGVEHLPAGAAELTPEQLQELAPGINPNGWHFYRMEERSFDAWDLAEALPGAATAAGVQLREQTPVLRVRSTAGGVLVETPTGAYEAEAFLNTSGAWSPVLDSALPVAPRKGHMLTAELPGPDQTELVLRTPKVYIVPRGGNRYTIGPTLEDEGFNKDLHSDRIQALLEKAQDLWPVLRNAHVADTWVGLRPGSEDDLPIIDAAGPRCWVATGHFKNGILLGPGTARAVSRWILGRQPEIDLSPFRAARFSPASISS